MRTSETKRDRWVSASLIIGAVLAGLAAVAVQRRSAAATRSAALPPPGSMTMAATSSAKPAAVPVPPKQPGGAQSPAQAPAQGAARPRVDVVFALDTTGSMSGLIEGAKRKIWSIASFIARGQPSPDLRVGLVAYRDVGDAYVTRVYDLDADLDRVYRRLLAMRADGGGDGPEHVARALHQAVHAMSWSDSAAAGETGAAASLRLIYLVGDAPPHVDYHDGYDFAKAARAAAQRGIQIHAIRCGTDPETASYWRRIAVLGRGEFLTIDQDGGMRDRHTPYDDELARLHDQLSDTVVPFGRGAGEAADALRAAAAAPLAVKAARAEYLGAKKEALGAGGDLVEEVSSGVVDLGGLAANELPPALARLPAPERKAKIAEKAHARGAILDRISTVSKDRDRYLRSDKAGATPATGFDAEVEKTLRRAGASAGLAF
jgi:hypothetical protein